MTLVFEVAEHSGPYTLFEKLDTRRLAHGYLFSGAAGVGKRHFAKALARSILCEAPKATLLGYDNTCASCKLIAANSHPDLLLHEGDIKIGDREGKGDEGLTARELVRALSLHGYGNSRRVVILSEVSFATHHAANALLKFFEEPPRGVHLLLTTSTPGKLLSTIRSRLIEIPFPPLGVAAMQDILRNDGVAADVAARVIPAAQGSVSRARSLIDGSGLREEVATWFFSATVGTGSDVNWASRAQLDDGLDLVSLLIRDWLVGSVSAERAALSGEQLRLRALFKNQSGALAAQAALQDARRLAATNVSPALVVDGLRLAIAEAAAS